MLNGRFRRMTAVAAAMLCLAATSYAQDTSVATPPTTGPGSQTGTAGGPPFDTTTMPLPMGMTDTLAATGDGDRDFPWGLLGLLGLLGLFKRGGSTTVVTRENYTSPPSGTRPGSINTGTGAPDRTMNLNPRPGGETDPDRR